MKRLVLVALAVVAVACADSAVAPNSKLVTKGAAVAAAKKPPVGPPDSVVIPPCNPDSTLVDGEWMYFCRNPQ